LNLILLRKIGIIGAAITTLAAELINASIMTYYSKQVVKERIIDIRNLIECIVGSIGVVAVCFLANSYISNTIIKTIVAISASVTVYAVFMVLVKNVYFKEFLRPLLNKLGR
jgi:O-antigen/teichoic acid export membrane protein